MSATQSISGSAPLSPLHPSTRFFPLKRPPTWGSPNLVIVNISQTVIAEKVYRIYKMKREKYQTPCKTFAVKVDSFLHLHFRHLSTNPAPCLGTSTVWQAATFYDQLGRRRYICPLSPRYMHFNLSFDRINFKF